MAQSELDKVRKEYSQIITQGNDISSLRIPKLPSGVMAFDIATRGGIPESRITEFYGPRSSGKSTMALRCLNQYNKKYPTGIPLYVDFEQTYDPDWAAHFVEDTGRIELILPDYGEQGVEALLKYAELPECNFIIIDSLAAMVPLGMLGKNVEEDTVGLHPKLVNKMLRFLINIMSVKRKAGQLLTVLIINQTRANVGAYGAAAKVMIKPGGHMKEFMYSMVVKFSVTGVKDAGGLPHQWSYEFKLDKNKTGLSRITGGYTMYQTNHDGHVIGELDENELLEKAAKKVGTLVRAGSKWTSFGREFKNLNEFTEALKEAEYHQLLKSETLRLCYGLGYGDSDGGSQQQSSPETGPEE